MPEHTKRAANAADDYFGGELKLAASIYFAASLVTVVVIWDSRSNFGRWWVGSGERVASQKSLEENV